MSLQNKMKRTDRSNQARISAEHGSCRNDVAVDVGVSIPERECINQDIS